MAAEYPGAVWSPSPNHSSRKGAVVDKIVLHITDGSPSLKNCVERFQRPETKSSPHFVVGRDGTVVQLVELDRAAWHASGWNRESVGIEHVCRSPNELKGWAKLSRETRQKLVENEADADSATDPGLMPTEAQIAASAALVKWLCERLGVPCDREHVVGHYESPTTTHEDCGLGVEDGGIWPWAMFLAGPCPNAQQERLFPTGSD
jgi:N-acetyl-anhydromuramyl-L-alanine amidase AmpD